MITKIISSTPAISSCSASSESCCLWSCKRITEHLSGLPPPMNTGWPKAFCSSRQRSVFGNQGPKQKNRKIAWPEDKQAHTATIRSSRLQFQKQSLTVLGNDRSQLLDWINSTDRPSAICCSLWTPQQDLPQPVQKRKCCNFFLVTPKGEHSTHPISNPLPQKHSWC